MTTLLFPFIPVIMPGSSSLNSTESIQKLDVTGLDGRQLISAGSPGENEMKFDLEAYPPGIYIARVQLQSRSVSLRFVKTE